MRAIAEAMDVPSAEAVPDAIRALNQRLGLPATLTQMGYGQHNRDAILAECLKSNFNRPSPHRPTEGEFRHMLDVAFG